MTQQTFNICQEHKTPIKYPTLSIYVMCQPTDISFKQISIINLMNIAKSRFIIYKAKGIMYRPFKNKIIKIIS